MSLNAWRVIADVSHTVSKLTLIWAIHANASAEGVSLITQALYAVVFCSRYVDIFWTHPFRDHKIDPDSLLPIPIGMWNFTLKIFYILSSLYILFIMLKVYGRTHEREKAWNFGYGCLGGSLLVAPFTMLIFQAKAKWSFFEYIWNFSEILEAFCILPQLLLLRQTSVPTVIDSFYLVTLGSYRFFYLLNWIHVRASGGHPETVSWIFAIVQIAFYIDFAWVYYSRQRVKLRNGALVDSEDFTKGWLVNRILSRAGFKGHDYDVSADSSARYRDPESGLDDDDADVDGQGINSAAPRRVGSQGGWGKRGVSVSADEDEPSAGNTAGKAASGESSRAEERRGMLQDLDDDEEPDRTVGGSEWK